MQAIAALLAAWLLLPDVTMASDESRRLTSRGLYLLQSGFDDDALESFEAALRADERDVDARYYRGLLRGRRGDLVGSIDDLRAALERKPDLHAAALELGVALVQSGEPRAAIPWLEQAQRQAEFAAPAALYLGVAYLRLQELDRAAASLARVESSDPMLLQAGQYYRALLAYQRGDREAAAAGFRKVVDESPGTAFAREAGEFLSAIESREIVPYRLRGSVGFEYDSNVILAPDDQALKQQAGVANQEDGRFTIAAGGSYIWRPEPFRVALGYDFFQSLHFDLEEFNLQDHRPSLVVSAARGPVQFGVLAEYNFYLKSDDRFLQEGTAMPWVALSAGDRGRTEFSYRMRRRDFLLDQFEVRDAFNHAFAARQVIFLGSPQRQFAVGYRFDVDDPIRGGESQRFAYFANEVNVGLSWDLPFDVQGDAGYAFRRERYRRVSSVYVNDRDARRDNEHDVVASLSRPINDHFDVAAGYSGTINDSNARAFTYDRHIASIRLLARW